MRTYGQPRVGGDVRVRWTTDGGHPRAGKVKAHAGRDNPMHLIARLSAMTSTTTMRATRSVARFGRRLSLVQDGARRISLPLAHDVVAPAASARNGERGSRPP